MPARHFTLFVPHGAPTFALNPGAIGSAMRAAAQGFAAPRAIVIVSPHWETNVPTVGSGTQLSTIHDFYGFDPALYALDYPASGSPQVAQAVADALQAHGLAVQGSPTRGLDHGAWIPLREMFPQADVPVVPLSVQPHLGPEHAWRVGEALAPLVAQGILVIGSGNITHNLRDWRDARDSAADVPEYVRRFSDWVAQRLAAGDADALVHYRSLTPDGARAHPTDEHLLPLLTACAAAGPKSVAHAYYRGISDHAICMDGYTFAPGGLR